MAVNTMYEDLGITQRDTCVFKKTAINYDPAGAREFSRRYLSDETFSKDKDFTFNELKTQQDFINEKQKRLLSIFNSIDSLKYLEGAYKRLLKQNEGEFKQEIIKLTETNIELIDQLDEIGLKRTFDKTGEVTAATLNAYIDSFFSLGKNDKGKTRFLNSKGKNMTEQEIKREIFVDLLKKAGAENPRARKDVEKVRDYLKTQLINKRIYNTLAERYWENFLKPQYKDKVISPLSAKYSKEQISWLKLSAQNKKDFIILFCQTLEGYPSIDFSQMAPTIRGFSLEFGWKMATTLAGDKNLLHIIGQELEDRMLLKYKGKDQPPEEKIVKAMSAADMILQGKYGQKKKYRLQLKNNLNDTSNFLNFRIQGDIYLSTFLETAFQQDQETKKTLEYLLVNICYLKQYGRGFYNKQHTEKVPFKWTGNEKLKNYIQVLLMTAYSYILSSEYLEKVEADKDVFSGNIAFVFKNNYLIPTAAFFVGAYGLLLKLVYYQENFSKSSIGGMMAPNLKSTQPTKDKDHPENMLKVPALGISPDEFQIQKYLTIWFEDKALHNHKKIYPDNLVRYSAEKSEEFYTDTKVRLNIGLALDSLERLLK